MYLICVDTHYKQGWTFINRPNICEITVHQAISSMKITQSMISYYLPKYLFRGKCLYHYSDCVLIFLFNAMQRNVLGNVVAVRGKGRHHSGKEATPGCF